ncbi:MAG: hypothetical protein J5I98_29280 [Phaeodactylibacter sp.]|nr:hypothetical protein [Phaeodactylibacter sp.]
MKSPFKFLDPYGPEDKEAFFGREEEARALYNLVTKNRLTFVYGPSGTGKTSLVQCGLASRFGGVDWLPAFIRRGDDINASLRRELGKALGMEGSFGGRLQEAVEQLFNHYLRPVYLIFDQFEELFILGASSAERQMFYNSIAELLEADLPCRVLFIMREDYFGHLNEFEKAIPELYHRKLRVEPMSRDNLRAVVAGSCSVAGIGFDDPAKAPEKILDNMLAGKNAIHMPYVQVYLHILFQEAARRQGADGQAVMFSTPVIDAVGPITDVLGQFLKEQETEIEARLQRDHPGAPEGIVRQVLDVFVTEEGTKAPVLYTPGGDGPLALRGKAAQRLANLPPAIQSDCILELERRRILRRLDDSFELAHDTLAQLADQQRTAEQRQLVEISRRIEAGYREHRDSGGEYFFAGSQLARIEPYLDKIALEPAWAEFLEKSRVEARRREEARIREAQEKLKRQRLFSLAIALVALVAIVAGILARQNASAAEEASQTANVSALAAKAWQVYRDDHTLALRLAQAALNLDSTNADARQTLEGIVGIPTTSFYQAVFSNDAQEYDITALDFSPDNQWVVSGTLEGDVRIWNRENGAEIGWYSFDNETGSNTVNSVRFHPDGHSIFVARNNGSILQIRPDGSVIQEFTAHQEPVRELDISPDGTLLATAGADSTAALWDTTGQLLAKLRGHSAGVLAIDISNDGRFVLSGSADGEARIWDTDGHLLRAFRPGDTKINTAVFSPDGQRLLFGCSDFTARLFAIDGTSIATIGGHTEEVVKVKFSPDGRYLITASADHTARIWSAGGEEILRLAGHPEALSALAISPDGNWIATGSKDWTAKVWSVPFNIGNKFSRHTEWVLKVAVGPDGKAILSGSKDNTAKLWDLNGQLLHDFAGHQGAVTNVAIAPGDNLFMTASEDGSVRIWDKNGQQRLTLEEFQSPVSAAALSPDGRRIAVSVNEEIRLFDIEGNFMKKWETGPLNDLDFSPDGRALLGAGKMENALLWPLDGGVADTIFTEGLPPYSAAFTPDGQQVITVSDQELAVRIWNRDGTSGRACYGHVAAVYHVVCARKGGLFATSSWDKTTRIWDMNGEPVQILYHPDGVYGADFLDGGRKIATACRDGLIRLWDVPSGKLLRTIGGPPDAFAILQDERAAALADIPFDPGRYHLDPGVVIEVFKDNPDNLNGFGNRYLARVKEDYYLNSGEGLATLSTAEAFYRQAREAAATEAGRVRADSLLAGLYQAKANVFLYDRKLPEFLEAAREGLQYRQLPMLRVFEALGQVMAQPDEAALGQALALAKDTTTVCAPCAYYEMLGEAVIYEADFYVNGLGIEVPGLRRFIARLEEEGLF